MSNLNVSLTDELVRFVKEKVASGRYGSSSEVVREALRIMERHEQVEAERLEYLRRAWREGIESGSPRPLNIEAVISRGRERLKAGDPAARR